MTNTNTVLRCNPITLPGNITGLLRRGSPVFWLDERTPWVVTWAGPWPESDIDEGTIALVAPGSSPCIGQDCNATNLALDLTDATGRAHAAWWLESRHVLRRHWPYRAGAYVSVGAMHERDKAGRCVYVNIGDVLYYVSRPVRRPGYLVSATTVPTLADLDPNDKTTLPDGSRRVDAEALRRVCLHVARMGE